MRKRWLLVLGLLAFLATLVLHAPAPLLYARALGDDAVKLHGVHGSLARGGFAALSVNSRVVLGASSWRINPAWLLLLRLSADVAAESGDAATAGPALFSARISRAVFGKLHGSDIIADTSIRSLLGASGQTVLPVEGQARLDLPSVVLDDGRLVHAEGTVQLQGLAWSLAREPLRLGDFSATLSTDDAGIVADLASGPGPLELSGKARLAAGRDYDLHIQLKPRAEASAQLQTLVRSLGQPDTQGWYHIRRQGQF